MIICKECGEPLHFLTKTHCLKHGLTKEEYIKKHGEPSFKNAGMKNIAKRSTYYDEYDKYIMSKR